MANSQVETRGFKDEWRSENPPYSLQFVASKTTARPALKGKSRRGYDLRGLGCTPGGLFAREENPAVDG
ncbi:hypothetical protein K0M31_019335 [Melipona bicolor]|uniref:Uncharacterized protein n=1 Tax=Melipona bicolor TaxID=60889 RepID=A0AA40G335_9HYME|nr:hypothetical protein K0M31_019335 [Melipona bicolor]